MGTGVVEEKDSKAGTWAGNGDKLGNVQDELGNVKS